MSDATLPGIRFRFPGIWSHIPLRVEAETKRAVRAIVRDLVGSDDSKAAVREAARRRVLDGVGQARELGATDVYFAEQVADGIPVSAMLSVHEPTIRMSVAVGSDAGSVMDAFVRGLESRGHMAPDAERFSVGASEVLRVVSERPADAAAQRVGELRVDFWVTVPGAKKLVPLTFVTPFVDLREPLTILFTAVVSSIEWRGPVQPEVVPA